MIRWAVLHKDDYYSDTLFRATENSDAYWATEKPQVVLYDELPFEITEAILLGKTGVAPNGHSKEHKYKWQRVNP